MREIKLERKYRGAGEPRRLVFEVDSEEFAARIMGYVWALRRTEDITDDDVFEAYKSFNRYRPEKMTDERRDEFELGVFDASNHTEKTYTATQIAELAGCGRQNIKDMFRFWREDREKGIPSEQRRGIPNFRVGKQDEATETDVNMWLERRHK